ncbi:Pr6Pr family membrane protein [Pedobacter sp. MR2016-24]|uniref:Pr6Pr family membrane protein n=1 Tax=Pedobacter sp. MR2016-24 TaxID=2994466 RepID=UPI002246700C|nr:Pr6Pr family membrane protein [Pedobacter sp. MR2016-24]MCX2482325.1 Pr6Pr family membrane protein [Pedobacter sp. MR2016-24]
MKNLFIAVSVLLGWFAVIAQLVLYIINRTVSLTETLFRFFSYFTILSNILVALCFTALLVKPKSAWGRIFTHSKVISGTVVYIIVVSAVYNLVLRQLWNPEGLQKIVDVILHSTMPMLFVAHWLFRVPKNELQWKNAFAWLLFPLLYIILVLIRGTFSDFYPYPFVDVSESGYNAVLINCAGLFIIFLVLSLLVIGTGKLISKYTGED